MDKITFTREELYQLVWSEPMLTIANKYLISDTGLRKICINMDIPLPRAGHWMKLKFGQKIPQPPLPKTKSQKTTIELEYRPLELLKVKGVLSPAKTKILLIEQELAETLSVPERLSKPEKIIVQAKENLTAKDSYPRNGLISTHIGFVNISVSKQNILRALRLMDTFIKSLRARGHDYIVSTRENYVSIKGEEIQIALREKTSQAPTKDKWSTHDYVPCGIFVLKTGRWSNIKEWSDGKQLLENQISAIIVWMENLADKNIEDNKEREIRRKIREEEERKEKEWQQRKEKELNDFKSIITQSSRWQKAGELRSYIEAVEAKAVANNQLTDKLSDWLQWLRDKADWYDPFIEKEDELLTDIDRDTLSPKKRAYTYPNL
jgi:hypothetical protein